MWLTWVGQLGLLAAWVATGHAASVCLLAPRHRRLSLLRTGVLAGATALACLTLSLGILAYALAVKDFRFAYVANYSDRLLPWHYSLSALWVGQAGSLLLWSWMSAAAALLFRVVSCRSTPQLREPAFGILMAFCCFLIGTMVFAADPMEASLTTVRDGKGLSPILQHPSMLVHPPVVFLGYTAWSIPFALAGAALLTGRFPRTWLAQARPWMLAAWLVSGAGILLGAQWAYEELGWGGYWGWDPVENGSLIPWLLGTAAIHSLMAWQHRGLLRKTTIVLLIATFAACNFATFLTRSGIFSSLHAFSQSPIGWLFLGLMLMLVLFTVPAMVARRGQLGSPAPITTLWCRESMIVMAVVALTSFAAVTTAGTVSSAVSDSLFETKVLVGAGFYNKALVPVALVVLLATGAAPLLNWKAAPSTRQWRWLACAATAGLAVGIATVAFAQRHPLIGIVDGLAAFGIATLAGSAWLGTFGSASRTPSGTLFRISTRQRRECGGYVVHLGLFVLAMGVAGSALGVKRFETRLRPGEQIAWEGKKGRLVDVSQHRRPGRLIAEATLEVHRAENDSVLLRPAQHYHLAREEWTTEVAIWHTWSEDFYTILHGNDEVGRVHLTLIRNPRMRWIWLGGLTMAAGCIVAAWPARRRHAAASGDRSATRSAISFSSARSIRDHRADDLAHRTGKRAG